MKSCLALCCLCFAFCRAQQALLSNIIVSATYRDFLPIQCMNVDQQRSQADEAWGVSNVLNELQNRAACNLLLDNNVWRDALESGEISGHPDFEVHHVLVSPEVCSSPDNSEGGSGINFPAGSCNFEPGNDETFSIVAKDLVIGANGLPKPQYCSDVDGDDTRCGFTTNGNTQTQTQKKWFDLWYNDDLKYNRRVGQRLQLDLDEDTGKYSFNAAGADSPDFPSENNGNFFGPLDIFKQGGVAEVEISVDPSEAPAWPNTCRGCSNGFWFTTELHTTFEFRSDADMTFAFSGDDDFWAFVNGKLVVDLGGVHDNRGRFIDLRAVEGDFSVKEFLDLEDRQIYTLDIFHAERQQVESNFALETTLFAACSVLQSGTKSFSFRNDDLNFTKNFVADGVTHRGNALELLKSSQTFAANSVFTTIQENVLRGFSATFDVKVNGKTDGFAFVIQSFGLDDLPKSSGKNFNVAGMTNSLAVVFDLCVDGVVCANQEVRIHFPDDPTNANVINSDTLKVHDRILRNLKTDEPFPVEITYFGGRPDFLEVYVNGSLYLRQNGFNIVDVIGSGGAHLGFTTSSSNLAADILIENFEVIVVEVDPTETKFQVEAPDQPQNVIADGIDVSAGVPIVTFDSCLNQLEAGTLQNQISAKFYQIQSIESRNLQNDDDEGLAVADAVIIDNEDGTYTISLQTEIVGDFALAVAFGEGCQVDVDVENSVASLVSIEPSKCFFENFNNGEVLVVSIPPEIPPTASPVDLDLGDDEEDNIVIVASTVGGTIFLAIIGGVLYLVLKKKWNKNKRFVKTGNMYRLDLNTSYDPNDEYRRTGSRLLETQQEILELQAQQKADGREDIILKLTKENEEMRQSLRESKKKFMASNLTVSKVKPKKKKMAKTSFDELL